MSKSTCVSLKIRLLIYAVLIYAVIIGNLKFKTALQNLPNIVCSGQFATFRFAAFTRSKGWFRFVSLSSWQPAAKTSRWATTQLTLRYLRS